MTTRSSHYIPKVVKIEAVERMIHRKEVNETVEQISSDTGISCSHLYTLEKKYRNDPQMEDNQRSGRPPKIDKYMERRILRAIKKNPFKSSVVLTQEINQGMDEEKQISNSSLKQTAIKNDIRAYKPAVKPKLEPIHIRTRLDFARNYGNMSNRFWQNVLYADEVSLQLHPADRRRRVRRARGERYTRSVY